MLLNPYVERDNVKQSSFSDIIRDKPTQLQTKFGCVTVRALIMLPQQKYRPDDL